jgi:glycosyltransferase involved in cell wall biosynthesis
MARSAHAHRPLVSVVCPFYNEGHGVDVFYEAMHRMFAANADVDFELVCVDDGSKDDTLERLVALSQRDARVRVIELSRNFGKEPALTAGLDAAMGDAVIPIDADLQDPPEVIPQLIAAWQAGAEVVLARRTDRSSDSLMKRKTAEAFYRFHNRVSDLKIPENVGDFRLMDRQAVEALRQLPERQRFMKGLFAWVGFKTVTIDYTRQPRAEGQSKFSGWKLWNLALEGITSFSTAPLKIWMYVGLIGAVVTFCYGAFIVLHTLISGVDVPGYASLLVSILFFGSLQLIGLGVLGEYIGRIYLESKQRPTYLVRKVYGRAAQDTQAGLPE